ALRRGDQSVQRVSQSFGDAQPPRCPPSASGAASRPALSDMDCQDVEALLGGFVDTELSPPELLDVARHAATCSACDGAIRELTDLRGELTRLLEDEVRQFDLSRVWPAVAATIPASRPRRAGIAALPRQLPVWGAVMALAASLLLWLGTSAPPPPTPEPSPAAPRLASRGRRPLR